MNRYLKLSAVACAAILSACGKDAVREITGPVPGAQVKFFNFATGSPGVVFYANTTKMTAIGTASGAESPLGTTYGQSAAGGLYAGITPGQYDLAAHLSDTASRNVVVSHLSTTLADGKYYSYYQSGAYNATTKTSDSFIIEDVLPARDFSVAYVRFVNAIANANPMTLYAVNVDTSRHMAEVALGGVVAYKSAGTFTSLPAGTYNLSTRYPGSGTNVITKTSVSFTEGHVYTISARGDITATSGTNKPALDNTANR